MNSLKALFCCLSLIFCVHAAGESGYPEVEAPEAFRVSSEIANLEAVVLAERLRYPGERRYFVVQPDELGDAVGRILEADDVFDASLSPENLPGQQVLYGGTLTFSVAKDGRIYRDIACGLDIFPVGSRAVPHATLVCDHGDFFELDAYMWHERPLSLVDADNGEEVRGAVRLAAAVTPEQVPLAHRIDMNIYSVIIPGVEGTRLSFVPRLPNLAHVDISEGALQTIDPAPFALRSPRDIPPGTIRINSRAFESSTNFLDIPRGVSIKDFPTVGSQDTPEER